ncbi:MAG: hypothetical protein V4517_14040 [Pseudomonadota bacterium]
MRPCSIVVRDSPTSSLASLAVIEAPLVDGTIAQIHARYGIELRPPRRAKANSDTARLSGKRLLPCDLAIRHHK